MPFSSAVIQSTYTFHNLWPHPLSSLLSNSVLPWGTDSHCALVCVNSVSYLKYHQIRLKTEKTLLLISCLFVFSLSSVDGQPTVLPPEQVQQLNLRSTAMLSNVQRLFSHHMIQTFGCDYSTSGITQEALQAKLRSFLDLCTEDGPQHDTYLIFYSGHTHKNTGAWALAGERLFFSRLLKW